MAENAQSRSSDLSSHSEAIKSLELRSDGVRSPAPKPADDLAIDPLTRRAEGAEHHGGWKNRWL